MYQPTLAGGGAAPATWASAAPGRGAPPATRAAPPAAATGGARRGAGTGPGTPSTTLTGAGSWPGGGAAGGGATAAPDAGAAAPDAAAAGAGAVSGVARGAPVQGLPMVNHCVAQMPPGCSIFNNCIKGKECRAVTNQNEPVANPAFTCDSTCWCRARLRWRHSSSAAHTRSW
jgi:hypothetical protein